MTGGMVDVELASVESRPLGWLRAASPAARRGLFAAFLAWTFDAFDILLYSIVLTSVLADFRISPAIGGLLGSLTLAASAFGGVLFGKLADRRGRRAALTGSILMYAIFTAACGLSASLWQLAICRILLGLGMGGTWTSAAALVSESWPDRHRGKAIALMHSGWAVGYALAALAGFLVLPRYGWRVTFLVGALPALLVPWIRRSIVEPDIWKASGAARSRRAGSVATLFSPPFRRVTIATTSLSVFTLYAYWGLNFWIPAYLGLPVDQHGVGLNGSTVALLLVTMQIGTWLGYVLYGYIADAVGRRRSFVAFLMLAAVLTSVYAATRSARVLLAIGPIVAFFGTGYFSGFGAISAELYPTAVRATAQGFTFNVGRIGSALAPLLIASLAQRYGFGAAFATTSGAFLLGACAWIWIPETRGRSLAA